MSPALRVRGVGAGRGGRGGGSLTGRSEADQDFGLAAEGIVDDGAGMRIAVISDTHDRYPRGLPERLKGADEIWHLGDVCDPVTLVEFESVGVPLHVVRGNCDEHAWPLALTLEREGVRFFLTHIPPAPERVAPRVKVVLHGHTHVPRDETVGGV